MNYKQLKSKFTTTLNEFDKENILKWIKFETMHWNYRILAHPLSNGNIYFQIHEVHYNDKDEPNGYSNGVLGLDGENINDINWTLEKMKESLNKPVLWAEENFPQEFKI